MPKYYPINEEAARRAKNANSFSDYVPGSATAAYREMVDRAYTLGKQQKGRVDPMYHEKIDGLIDRYARKLAENINQSNLIDARVPSILIAGGSNFPVRKKEKQNAARDKNMGEYMQIGGCWIRCAQQVWAGSAQTMTGPWKSWRRSWQGWRPCRRK